MAKVTIEIDIDKTTAVNTAKRLRDKLHMVSDYFIAYWLSDGENTLIDRIDRRKIKTVVTGYD